MPLKPRRLKYLTAAVFALLALCLPAGAAAGAGIELKAKRIPQGGMTVFKMRGAGDKPAPSAVFGGGGVFLMETPDFVAGIVAADLEAEPGKYELAVSGPSYEFKAPVRVVRGNFKTQRLNLAKELVDLDEETGERVWYESLLIADSLRDSRQQPFWAGPFVLPVKGRVTGRFGYRRLINGHIKGIHGGVDIAAPEGAPIAASNRGRVVLAADFFVHGRVVVIDHGAGVFTKYLHLKDIAVEDGSVVEKGETIGTVGMTGRATGPHLHWSVVIGGARVSPVWFVRATEALEEEVNGR